MMIPTQFSNKVGLIDGDLLVYKAAFQCDGSFATGRTVFAEQLMQLVLDLELVDYKLCLSCRRSEGFRRNRVNFDYKANRDKDPRELPFLPELKAYAKEAFGGLQYAELEADDIISILATGGSVSNNHLIVSHDKDFKTLPCMFAHVRMVPTYRYEFHEVSEQEANFNLMTQALVGDSADNYKGVPGIGPKKAAAILHPEMSVFEMWDNVVKTYEKKGLTSYDAILTMRQAYLLRHTDIDKDTGEYLLWSPETHLK